MLTHDTSYFDKRVEDHNMLYGIRVRGGTLGRESERTEVVRFADMPGLTYADIAWHDYPGWGTRFRREILFVKGLGWWVRDRTDANEEAGKIVAQAEAKAKKIIETAEAEAAATREKSRTDLQLAARDTSFRLREGMPIAAAVTLRGDRMYEFVDRLCNVALPRVRDFRGLPTNSFDGRGNYTLGLKDQIIFPEVDYAKVEKLRGMNVTFVTTARTDEESKLLLASLGMPFRTQ